MSVNLVLRPNYGLVLEVTSVMPDGPARMAGLETGDAIYTVNGKEFRNCKTVREAIEQLQTHVGPLNSHSDGDRSATRKSADLQVIGVTGQMREFPIHPDLRKAPNEQSDSLVIPIATYAGKQTDTSKLALLPEDKVITNQESLEKVLAALNAPDLIPQTIDWNAEMVLVVTVRGPNQVRFVKFTLNGGNLDFAYNATLAGGPGFGYSLVRIPRKGIKQVKGIPVR